MPKRKDMKYWNIPVTEHLNNVVDKAVLLNAHVSKSDLIRSAVREKLVSMGMKEELENVAKET
jgi:Arc/MetJ-type ribon-helix-helix transcriptional regulator